MNSDFDDFISRLESAIQYGLPGERAQRKMAPIYRGPSGIHHSTQSTPKQGAVLILIYPCNNEVKTVLINRSVYNGYHSNQVGFPGGKKEDKDTTLYMTALREAEEEIGIEKNNVNLVGELSNLYIPVSNFNVSPFIASASQKPVFIPNEREVRGIIEFDLNQLNTDKIKSEKQIQLSNGLTLRTPCYDISGNIVWGATAMIISELHELMLRK